MPGWPLELEGCPAQMHAGCENQLKLSEAQDFVPGEGGTHGGTGIKEQWGTQLVDTER